MKPMKQKKNPVKQNKYAVKQNKNHVKRHGIQWNKIPAAGLPAFWIFVLVLITAAVHPAVSVNAATGVLTGITAVYTGDSVAIGEKLSASDVYVTGYYVAGGRMITEQIKNGFALSTDTITSEGENRITVTCQGYSAEMTVQGKRVLFVEALYSGTEEITIGSEIPKKNLKVTAYYTDGTRKEITNYTLPVSKIYQKGINTFSVVYGSHMTTFDVPGKEALAVESLFAYYSGAELIVGNDIDKSQVEVTAFYNDGRLEQVKNFSLSPSAPTKEGFNTIIVSYGGSTTTMEVYAREKVMEAMEARYIGPGVVLGKMVDKKDIEVIATYDDGTKQRISTFETSGSIIEYEGDNVVLVYCDYFVREIVVPGVKGFVVSYDNSFTTFLYGRNYEYSEVTLALNKTLPLDSFIITQLEEEAVRQAVERVIPTEEFIGFTVTYEQDDMIREFPMAMKLTVPAGYDPERFGVYYTPNQRTIMAKLNGEFTDEEKTVYQVILTEPGTYVIVHEAAEILVSEIEIEEEMTLRAGRNYSLTPIVLPVIAQNKAISYWSSDEEIATVTENGKLRTYREGTCDIWIEAQDGSGVSARVTLTVKKR